MALPEYLQYRGDDDGYRASARPIPGPFTTAFSEIARRRDCWILAGSLAESSDDPDRPYNTSALIAPSGDVVARYRKIHLFDVAVEAGPADIESARVTPGDELVVADVDGVRLGLTICYDLRFAELYRSLSLLGAEVLTVPANFTERTGRDHWEVLLRARAIENGAYVLAPVAGQRAARPAGLRADDDRRSVGHGRRPGARPGRHRPRRARHGAGRLDPAPDPRPREPQARDI